METQSKQRNVRVPRAAKQYVMEDGSKLDIPLLEDNVPRISGIRTANDRFILKSNNGKLSILQR